MPIKAPKQESNFDIVPTGNHVARVYRILHIGTIPEMYMGEEKMMNKIMIGFELLNETKVFRPEKGLEPYVISAEYTLSMNSKANLRKLIEGMYGIALHDDEAEAFDALSIISQECLINVVHKTSASGNQYAVVKGASPIPKGMTVPPPHNAVQKLDYDEWNEEAFQALPNFIKEKIMKSIEYKKMKGVTSADEIPF